jgi:hypothetical protein
VWHAIHNGVPITIRHPMPEDTTANVIYYEQDAQRYILAIQGTCDMRPMDQCEPSSFEVSQYQKRSYDTPMPGCVSSLEEENILRSHMNTATYGTELDNKGEKIYVYVAPRIVGLPRDNTELRHRMPFLRAGVIANASLAGYWHSNLRGVALRAYLKGHYSRDTIWPSAVLGWRASSTSDPIYFNSDISTRLCKGMIMLDGIERSTSLDASTVDVRGTDFKVVSKSGIRSYNNIYAVDSRMIPFIVAANGLQRYDVPETDGFLTVVHAENRVRVANVSQQEARSMLLGHLFGETNEELW